MRQRGSLQPVAGCERQQSWTAIIARVGLSALLLPVLLISSLLSIPTSCRCGAALPHVHTIFDISGHTHRAHGSAEALGGDPGPGHPHADEHDHAPAGQTLAGHAPGSVSLSGDAAAVAGAVHVQQVPAPQSIAPDSDATEMADVQPTGSTPAVPAVGWLLEESASLVPGPSTAVRAPEALVLVGHATTPDAPPPRAHV